MEPLPAPGHQAAWSRASCWGWAGSSPAVARSSCQRHHSGAGEMGTATSCPQPGRGWGAGGGVCDGGAAASAHCSLPHTCNSSRGRAPAGHLLPVPRQPHGGSPRASRELMLQMKLLICQLLIPAQAPAEVCLNSGNCTNMVLFLPRAKPYGSCITSGCLLEALLA